MSKSIVEIVSELQDTVSRGETNIARYKKAIEDELTKMSDAKTTLRTLHAMGIPAVDNQPQTEPFRRPPPSMTVPDMIFWVMRKHPDKGFEPASMIVEIKNTLGLEPDPNNVRPTMWRMKQDGRLTQDDSGRYWLAKLNEARDDFFDKSTSLASVLGNPEQDREAGQGGGA